MSHSLGSKRTRVGNRFALAGLATASAWVMLAMPSTAVTEPASEPIVRVEEDWRLVLNEPDHAVDAPQFHTVMSPYADLESVYMQATWNYWEQPDFESGGLQLQTWESDQSVADKGFFERQQLSTNTETITWTQVLDNNGEVLFFGIENAQSQTWGAFGGENMKVHTDRHVSDLNGYRPEVSATNSWVTYGANRVDLLVITAVRYYGRSGLLYQDTTARVIYQLSSE